LRNELSEEEFRQGPGNAGPFAFSRIVSLPRRWRVIFLCVRIFTAVVLPHLKMLHASARKPRVAPRRWNSAKRFIRTAMRELPKKTVAKNFASLIT
jgi:hypothetical protein